MSIQPQPIGCADHMSANAMTVVEMKKKRAYKRKDSGGGGGDTTLEIKKNKRAYRRKKYLPPDLIIGKILTKLPVPALLRSVLVSKLWYNSIHNDHKRLTHSHFVQSQKQPDIIFSLLNVRDRVDTETGEPRYGSHFFKFTTGIYSHEYALKFDKFRGDLTHTDVWELVGYRNGLPCVALVGNYTTAYIVLDPNRKDFIFVYHPVKVGIRIPNAHIICHGFGFNSSANEYKLVSVFRTAQKEINIVVFTLGTKSWRDITATSMPISGHGIIKLRAPTGTDKPAIFCATSSSSSCGCLVWKVIATLGGDVIQNDNISDVSNEMEMLLSFNLHDEKFRFIQLPAKSTSDEQQKHLIIDYPHLLEFKGFPCIARIEKKSENGSDYPHRCRGDHKDSSSCCCCCCKVHLYVLKDQAWVKEECIDVRIKSTPTWLRNLGPAKPDPCCFCFGSTTTPPTRIFSFSDQMYFYWFNEYYLQVYNLRSEKLQVVLPYDQAGAIFVAKRKESHHIYNSGDVNYSSNMDYQLHCHEENFLSLETFIPEGVERVDADVFNELDLNLQDRPCSAYVFIYRASDVFYPCFI